MSRNGKRKQRRHKHRNGSGSRALATSPPTRKAGRRVLFLDFDGVLNTPAHLVAQYSTQSQPRHLESAKIELLNELCKDTGCEVVVTSAWRFGRQAEALRQHLEAHGFTGNVVGVTPHFGGPRGVEIQAWLDVESQQGRHVDLFAILDDDCDAVHLDKFLVRTDPHKGLTAEDCAKAKRLLALRSDLERFMAGHDDVNLSVIRQEFSVMAKALNGLLTDLINAANGTESIAEEYINKTSPDEFMRGFFLGKGRGMQSGMNVLGHTVNKAQLVGFRGVDK